MKTIQLQCGHSIPSRRGRPPFKCADCKAADTPKQQTARVKVEVVDGGLVSARHLDKVQEYMDAVPEHAWEREPVEYIANQLMYGRPDNPEFMLETARIHARQFMRKD